MVGGGGLSNACDFRDEERASLSLYSWTREGSARRKDEKGLHRIILWKLAQSLVLTMSIECAGPSQTSVRIYILLFPPHMLCTDILTLVAHWLSIYCENPKIKLIPSLSVAHWRWKAAWKFYFSLNGSVSKD